MTQIERRYGFFNRIVLSHCELWLKQHIKERESDLPEICYLIKSAGYASRVINAFSDDEARILEAIAKDEEFIPIKEKEISLVIMALEVMKVHVTEIPKELRTPKLNISDKRLKVGKGAYAIHMLKAKRIKPELYEEQKEIIDDTSNHAKVWYSWMRNAIINGKYEKEK